MTGTIRNIREDRHFAFIVSGVNRDIFLHKHNYHGNWNELLALHAKSPVTVEFEIEENEKGIKAIKCRVISNETNK